MREPEDVLDASFFITAGDTVPITVPWRQDDDLQRAGRFSSGQQTAALDERRAPRTTEQAIAPDESGRASAREGMMPVGGRAREIRLTTRPLSAGLSLGKVLEFFESEREKGKSGGVDAAVGDDSWPDGAVKHDNKAEK